MLVLSVLKNLNYFGSLLKFQFENHCFTFQVFFRHLTAFCEECSSYSILWVFMTLFTEKHDKHLLMFSLLTNHFFDLDLIQKNYAIRFKIWSEMIIHSPDQTDPVNGSVPNTLQSNAFRRLKMSSKSHMHTYEKVTRIFFKSSLVLLNGRK